MAATPSYCSSRPLRMLSSVDLPPPDGPRMHTNSPGRTLKLASSSARQVLPPFPGKVLETWLISIDPAVVMLEPALHWAPTEQMTFQLAEQDDLNEQHDEEEEERVRQHLGHVEHLVVVFDAIADAVAAPEQFDEQHHLPYQAEAEFC